jgi:hypothetical protein
MYIKNLRLGNQFNYQVSPNVSTGETCNYSCYTKYKAMSVVHYSNLHSPILYTPSYILYQCFISILCKCFTLHSNFSV